MNLSALYHFHTVPKPTQDQLLSAGHCVCHKQLVKQAGHCALVTRIETPLI